MKDSIVTNPNLAPQGHLKIAYAEMRMQPLLRIRDALAQTKPFAGMRIGMALHVTKETAVLVQTLRAAGAEVAIASCNPLSTQDDVAAALAESGVSVFAKKGETEKEYYEFIRAVIETEPHITIDDGCDLVTEIHQNYPQLIPQIIGGCEETTTGIIRLRAMEKDGALKYPIIAVNDNKTKHLFDNYYGTGQSTWDGILRATNVLVAGKTVVISGYGDCGKGVALRAKGLGARVIVTEVDPFKALQASMDGNYVMPLADAIPLGDIFITVTGNKHVLRKEHFEKMKNGVILANAGHFNVEIDVDALGTFPHKRVRDFLEEYLLKNGNRIYLVSDGRLCNLAAAEGHPSEVMALSFAGQTLACKYLVENKDTLQAHVLRLPDEIDAEIARLALEADNIHIDTLTPEQAKYLASWREGT